MSSDKNQQMKLVGEALAAAIEAIGGQPREGQIQMAEAVANALTDRHHLLVQAGTGTGKSLAYLVPALVHGKKVLVATATLALQRQLVERDLPKIQPALEKVLQRDLTFAVYKGVGNYLCLQKMNGAEQDPDGEVLMEIGILEKDQKRLKAWARLLGLQGIAMMPPMLIAGSGRQIRSQAANALAKMIAPLDRSVLPLQQRPRHKLLM